MGWTRIGGLGVVYCLSVCVRVRLCMLLAFRWLGGIEVRIGMPCSILATALTEISVR